MELEKLFWTLRWKPHTEAGTPEIEAACIPARSYSHIRDKFVSILFKLLTFEFSTVAEPNLSKHTILSLFPN